MNPKRPVHTFSIVARDPGTGEFGVAVQSHWFSVGSIVPWAAAGVGALATQSFANPDFGPAGLALLKAGRSPEQVLAELLAADPGRDERQVALVDRHGQVAAHTGERSIPWAGHQMGEGYSVQANIMVDDRTVPAMASAFEKTRGPLGERLLAALEAGQAAGGDLRGRQSAALRVVGPEATGAFWEDQRIDLRVDDHPQPIEELRRLHTLHTAYAWMNSAEALMVQGEMDEAVAHFSRAADLAPEQTEIALWKAICLALNQRLEEAMPLFERIFEHDPHWARFIERLPQVGMLEPALAEKILRERPDKTQ